MKLQDIVHAYLYLITSEIEAILLVVIHMELISIS